jgi:hypothetical protein
VTTPSAGKIATNGEALPCPMFTCFSCPGEKLSDARGFFEHQQKAAIPDN